MGRGPASSPGVRRRACARHAELRPGRQLRHLPGLADLLGTPLTLLGRTPGQVAEAQRELTRIGIDRPAAAAVGSPGDWAGGRALRSYPVADFADLEAVRRHRPVVILDVRRDSEWAASHIAGAVHIPIHQLPSRLAEVPAGEVWVHCEAGYRASVAASFLDAAGRTVVAVDDEFPRAARAGLARHIPLGQLSRRSAELPDGRAVVTVCRSGARSARAAAMLARDGREVSNLAGGMRAWARAGLPVVARGGAAGRVA